MKACEIFAVIFGVVIFGGLCGYVGYIFYKRTNNVDSAKIPSHIILIVADDLGWNDVSFHGADQIHTPNIDALAYNGVILNRHYVLPTGTLSRTALMTGRYPIRYGMQGTSLLAGEPQGVPLNVTLMPEYLRRLGYETRLLGKWNLGSYTKNHTPSRRGFDSFFSYYNGLISYINKTGDQPLKNGSLMSITYGLPSQIVTGYDLHRDGPNGLNVELYNTEYFTDVITAEAEKIIRNNGKSKQLFLEISHLAAHATFSKVNPLEVRNTTENDETFKYIKDEKRRRYAGIVTAMDESVGRVVKALSDTSMLNNSIIVFISDNGAQTRGFRANSGSNYPLRGLKHTLFEGGIRSVACIFSPLIKKPEKDSQKYIHVSNWLPTLYSAAGGNVSNLGDIDGVDQWQSLVYNLPSPREKILLNIDEKAGTEAAIIGRYKLIKEAANTKAGYYGDTGKNSSYPVYNVTEALNSTAGRAIGQLLGLSSSTEEEAQQLRKSAIVRCQHPSNYSRCLGTCLFDIASDPCETRDLSTRLPKILSSLKSFIENYSKSMVRQADVTIDPCSFPQYFNGTWMPWRRDDANSSTIIPRSLCNDHNVARRKHINTNNTNHTNTMNNNNHNNSNNTIHTNTMNNNNHTNHTNIMNNNNHTNHTNIMNNTNHTNHTNIMNNNNDTDSNTIAGIPLNLLFFRKK